MDFDYRNYDIIICWHDIPTVHLAFDAQGNAILNERLTDNDIIYPIEFKCFKEPKAAFESFISERIAPPYQHNILKTLKKFGVNSYNRREILETTHGCKPDSAYWIKHIDFGPQTFMEAYDGKI